MDNSPVRKVYRSKVDTWLLVVLIFVVISSIFGSYDVMQQGNNYGALTVMVALGVLLPIWLLLGTRYVITTTKLTIWSGPFRWSVLRDDITAIKATRNPLASPALSLDRLRIEFGRNKAVMVSPRNKEKFIQDVRDI